MHDLSTYAQAKREATLAGISLPVNRETKDAIMAIKIPICTFIAPLTEV